MTDKSDAQLDAEAAGPKPSLDPAIAVHRQLWRDDNNLPRLVSHQPPLTRYEQGDIDLERTGATNEFVYEQGAVVGMSMSGPLLRRLSEPPGQMFPWVNAYYYLRHACRRSHPYHRAEDRPYWRGALCHEAVRFVVVREYSVLAAARFLRYDALEPVLREAFRIIDEKMATGRALAEKRAAEDEGLFSVGDVAPPAHHPLGGLHAEECPQCRAA